MDGFRHKALVWSSGLFVAGSGRLYSIDIVFFEVILDEWGMHN